MRLRENQILVCIMYKFTATILFIFITFSGNIFSDDEIHNSALTSQTNEIKLLSKEIHRLFSELNKDRQVPIITAKRLKRIIDDPNLILIDVRKPAEYNVSILPNAITQPKFEKKYANKDLSDKKIIVYCTIGERSGRYVQKMRKRYPNMYNLIGGILSWSLENGELYKKSTSGKLVQTNDAHTYNKEWNYLNPTYNAVY